MNCRVWILCLMLASIAYQVFISLLALASGKKPIPENVKDVYDAETYGKWRSYNLEKTRAGIFGTVVCLGIQALLVWFGFYGWAVSGIRNVYWQSIALIAIFNLVDAVTGLPFSCYDTFQIEEKYGFNKSTVKTFLGDQVKSLIIMTLVLSGLVSLLGLIHRSLGDWIVVLFTGVLAAFMLGVTFLYPVFTKIFNKFTPLEDGSLKENLTALLEKYGYKVRTIDVMDASRRTTKSNAYFTGFGRMKTIVLYDTLLEAMDEDEVCAVFAHEMGHGIHKDTLKMQLINMLQFLTMSVLLWLTLRSPELMQSFGFDQVNYGFAGILLFLAEMPVAGPLLGLLVNGNSRRAEYRADRQAVLDGYGGPLISGLKKLTRENFADLAPTKLEVALVYSHPPISQRIDAIERELEKAEAK